MQLQETMERNFGELDDFDQQRNFQYEMRSIGHVWTEPPLPNVPNHPSPLPSFVHGAKRKVFNASKVGRPAYRFELASIVAHGPWMRIALFRSIYQSTCRPTTY